MEIREIAEADIYSVQPIHILVVSVWRSFGVGVAREGFRRGV